MLSYALKTMLISSQIFCFKAHFYVDFKDQAWDNDRHAISLDFIKAFDMVWHSYSEEQLIKMPIPDNIRIIDNWQYLITALCQIRAMHLYLIETYLPPLKDVCVCHQPCWLTDQLLHRFDGYFCINAGISSVTSNMSESSGSRFACRTTS